MSAFSDPAVWQFAEMLLALIGRTTAPQLPDPSHLLDHPADFRRFPAALLVALCGSSHPRFEDAIDLLGREEGEFGSFFLAALENVHRELTFAAANYPDLLDELQAAAEVGPVVDEAAAYDLVWRVMFPAGVGLSEDWEGAVTRLRARRRVEIMELNPDPITDPLREVLLTANVLVSPDGIPAPPDHWYDHPIPLDVDPTDNELAHGLRRLDAAVAFELARNPQWHGPVNVALSVSSTHDGLENQGRALVEQVVARIEALPNLRVFVFDETSTRRLWDVMSPTSAGADTTLPVFGVSGPYGRHYSFLKAIAAVWSVCIDTEVRATFKIDLDQSFPQSNLLAETGQTAFEHLTTQRWGARGRSSTGQDLDLAMIAGGLVNAGDVEKSIFTPDIDLVPPGSSPEHVVFFSRLPQVLSTEAEIVSRYDSADVDGVAFAQERVHVTGGTNGILVAGLRRWRLFTPSVFGRAEDQAYLVSGLGGESRPAYVHEPGLIMSHDKAQLIPGLIERGAGSKHIGDLLRTGLFSKYVTAAHERLLDPFTGCFVSRLPLTVTTLRFALRALDPEQTEAAAMDYMTEGIRRLRNVDGIVADLDNIVSSERREWNVFYDSLDAIETGLVSGDGWAQAATAATRRIIERAEVGRRQVPD